MSSHPYACEGECGECSGNVRRVHVRDPIDKFDWGYFHYCDIAVQDDMRMGFEVKDAPSPPEPLMPNTEAK